MYGVTVGQGIVYIMNSWPTANAVVIIYVHMKKHNIIIGFNRVGFNRV